MPCGFCGRSGIATCAELYLTTSKKSPQTVSSCEFAHKFHYKPALESTDTGPSTNVGIKCTIPGCAVVIGKKVTAIWKYNMEEHIHERHPDYALDGLTGAPIPADLALAMQIRPEEERRIGIPAHLIPKPLISQPFVNTAELADTRSQRKRSAAIAKLSVDTTVAGPSQPLISAGGSASSKRRRSAT